ncbi:MAG: DUF899 domain-containing protein [Roseateles sp.]|uniref:DUF899 domain-containing protein n=1 Tax=Roseateles sp. TaxID=1971397 RepID=UPI004037494B
MSTTHPVVTRDRWINARKALLAQEKELTRLRDQVASERRALPWATLEQDYLFDTPAGARRLSELFQGRRQLLVQHFMLGPGWEQGCKSCSFMADHLDGMAPHLAQRDITLLVVSRAPLAEIEAFKRRMGWRFDWASSNGNDFNRDFHVSFAPEDRVDGEVYYNFHMTPFPKEEAPGISVFCKDEAGQVFHSYSTFGRGVEVMMGAYSLIDLTPKGRDELTGQGMAWVRHHDRYESAAPAPSCCGG